MKSFKIFIIERYKSEHEPEIRQIASAARQSFLSRLNKDPDRFAEYGDCTDISDHVVSMLKKKWPLTKMVSSTKINLPSVRGPNKEHGGHSWIEIPEIDHFVDPTNDQFHKIAKSRINAPQINKLYPDNIVKIGNMKNKLYK